MRRLPALRRIVIYSVIGAAPAGLLLFPPAVGASDLPLLGLFLVLGVLAEAVSFPSLYRPLFMGFALVFPWFILRDLGTAVWLGGVTALAGRLAARRAAPLDACFAAGRAVLGVAAAGLCYRLAGGEPAPLAGADWPALSLFSPAFLAASWGLERLGQRPFWPGAAAVVLTLSGHVVLTAFGLLIAAALILQGAFALFLVLVALGAVIHLMHLHEELQVANNELKILHDTTGKLNATLRLDSVFRIVAEAVSGALAPQFLGLYLFQEEDGRPVVTAVKTHGGLDGEAGPAWEPLATAVAVRRRAILAADATRDPVLSPLLETMAAAGQAPPRAFLGAPLLSDGRLVGVLIAGCREANRFGPKHLRLISIMGGQVAAAIKNAVLYEKTENMAITDHLTGLYNYRYLFMRLEEEIRKARSREAPLALIYLDLDDFKQCNDVYGHLAGDHLLCQFAEVLRRSIRQTDVPARYAGDEFVVILPQTTREEAWEVVQRIKVAVHLHPFEIRGRSLITCVAVSAGVACFPDDAQTVDDLISQADKSMYRDKHGDADAV